jgi:hypothetical protein
VVYLRSSITTTESIRSGSDPAQSLATLASGAAVRRSRWKSPIAASAPASLEVLWVACRVPQRPYDSG